VQRGVKSDGRGAAHGSKSRWRARLSGFLKNRRGAAIVEFAIIAAVLFLLIFGIIEICLLFWASYELENGVATAARLVRTGQVQSGGLDASKIKAQLCSQAVILSNCSTAVQLDVETFGTLGAMQAPAAVDGAGKLRSDFTCNPGGPGAYVLVTAFYEWPLVIPLTSAVLGNLANGNFLLRAAAAFKNEPFPPTGAASC
jgi:Flp pilus assembly protein TadG